MNNSREDYVFGLDIGTRSIVGTVGYRTGTDRFVVVAQKSLEHTTRAVIDGQIHDIATVADEIASVKKQLEEEIGQKLTNVSIAAAGRVLNAINAIAGDSVNVTVTVSADVNSLPESIKKFL